MKVIRYNVGPMDNNTYLVIDEPSGDAALVDPSFASRRVWDNLLAEGLRLRWVLNTHAHLDHVVENSFFTGRSGAPLALHEDDIPLLRMLPEQAAWMGIECPAPSSADRVLKDVDTIAVGGATLAVVHTPGHSLGSVTFLGEGAEGETFALVGDVLFAGGIGRTDLPGGSSPQLLASIRTQLLPTDRPPKCTARPEHPRATSDPLLL
ncbi:MAG: MBL fold metallo-hydrolase [Chloroflexi bacterium]|nr:MBL fold metallo-hydrolase [Chloroflexota bacterium]